MGTLSDAWKQLMLFSYQVLLWNLRDYDGGSLLHGGESQQSASPQLQAATTLQVRHSSILSLISQALCKNDNAF